MNVPAGMHNQPVFCFELTAFSGGVYGLFQDFCHGLYRGVFRGPISHLQILQRYLVHVYSTSCGGDMQTALGRLLCSMT